MFFSAFAQDIVTTYTKGNGLPSNYIQTTKVDSKGIVWVGTSNGVSAYINDQWVEIRYISDNKGNTKNVGRVSIIFEASNGNIWVTSQKGIFIFNGSSWTHFDDEENEGFIVSDIFEDRRGWVWVMYEKYQSLKDIGDIGFSLVEGVIQMYNGRNWHRFQSDIGGTAAIALGDPNKYFTSHIQDFEGNLWITNMDGTYKFDGYNWDSYRKDPLPSDICYDIIQAADKSIWVATKYGISVYSDSNWVNYYKNKGLKGNSIEHLFQDKHSRVWAMATKDNRFRSLCCFENGNWKSFSKEKIKIKGEVELIMDFNDQLLAYSKRGISLFNGKSWVNLLKKNDVYDGRLADILRVSNDKALITSAHGLREITSEKVVDLFNDSDGWKPSSLLQDSDGNIWVGTERDGAYKINKEEIVIISTENGLPSNNVIEIFEDRTGNIWIVTKSGISKYKQQ